MTALILIILTAAGVIIAFFAHIDSKIKDTKQDLKAD